VTTLAQHLAAADPDLAAVVLALGRAGLTIGAELARAALVGQTGATGDTNVQGETVKKLDVWANEAVVDALRATGRVCLLISEEMAEPLHLDEACGRAPFVVAFDPVDGSSNLDVNGIVGTIFSIRGRRGRGGGHAREDALSPGTAQVAAGYVMYGPATQLVFTLGAGVSGFTLDRARGEFVRSHDRIEIPTRGRCYSVNEGATRAWPDGVRRLVEHLKEEDVATGRPYTARYAGSLVTDVHRTLLEGGIFLYPPTHQRADGKLRLLYEAAPVAWVVEQAGGRASTGRARVLDVRPDSPHQRVPLFIGSPEDVALAEDFVGGRRDG
jgi:fructose-1,6-bisphosphatase I